MLVLGFGNVLLGDDGAGVRLVERLGRELGPGAAQFVDGGTMSFSLLAHVEDADSMLLVDAVNLHRPAGTVEVFDGAAMDEFLLGTRRRSAHEVGLIDLLDTARLLGALPPRRALLCIQPLNIDWCDSLSAPVDAAFPLALQRASAILEAWKTA